MIRMQHQPVFFVRPTIRLIGPLPVIGRSRIVGFDVSRHLRRRIDPNYQPFQSLMNGHRIRKSIPWEKKLIYGPLTLLDIDLRQKLLRFSLISIILPPCSPLREVGRTVDVEQPSYRRTIIAARDLG